MREWTLMGIIFLFLHLVAENDVCFCKFLAPSLKYKEDFLFFKPAPLKMKINNY